MMYHVVSSFSQFYSALRFVTTNKICVAILSNLWLGIGVVVVRLTISFFIGNLASDEQEHVKHSMKLYLSDLLIAVATSHRSFPSSAAIQGAILLALRYIHLALDIKAENLVRLTSSGEGWSSQSDTPQMNDQASALAARRRLQLRFLKMFLLGLFLFGLDAMLASKQLSIALEHGLMNSNSEFISFFTLLPAAFQRSDNRPIIPSSTGWAWYTSLLIFGEYVLLCFSALRSLTTFCMNYYEIYVDFDFPKKPFVAFFTDMAIDGAKLIFVGSSTVYIGAHASLPFHYVRDCVITLSACQTRLAKFFNYLTVLRQVSKNFTDVPKEAIEAEEIVCIVCRDNLKVGESCKETRCGHRFHFQCLKEWLERNTKCPICQASLLAKTRIGAGGRGRVNLNLHARPGVAAVAGAPELAAGAGAGANTGASAEVLPPTTTTTAPAVVQLDETGTSLARTTVLSRRGSQGVEEPASRSSVTRTGFSEPTLSELSSAQKSFLAFLNDDVEESGDTIEDSDNNMEESKLSLSKWNEETTARLQSLVKQETESPPFASLLASLSDDTPSLFPLAYPTSLTKSRHFLDRGQATTQAGDENENFNASRAARKIEKLDQYKKGT